MLMSIRFSCVLAAMLAMLVGGCASTPKPSKPSPSDAIDPRTAKITQRVVRYAEGAEPDYSDRYWRVLGRYEDPDEKDLTKRDTRGPLNIFLNKLSNFAGQQKVEQLITAKVVGLNTMPAYPILHITSQGSVGQDFTPFTHGDNVEFVLVPPRLIEGLPRAHMELTVYSSNETNSNLFLLAADAVVAASSLTSGRTVAKALDDRITAAAQKADLKLAKITSETSQPRPSKEEIWPISQGTDVKKGVKEIKVYAVDPDAKTEKLILTIANQSVETLLGPRETFESVPQSASRLLQFEITRKPDDPNGAFLKISDVLETANLDLFGPLTKKTAFPDPAGERAFIQSFCARAEKALDNIFTLTRYDRALVIWALLAESPWANKPSARPGRGEPDACAKPLEPLTEISHLQKAFHGKLQDPRPVGDAAVAWASDKFKKLRGDAPYDEGNSFSIPAVFATPPETRAKSLTGLLANDTVIIGTLRGTIAVGDTILVDTKAKRLDPGEAATLLASLPLTWVKQPDLKCFAQVASTDNQIGMRANGNCLRLVADKNTKVRTLFLLDGTTSKIRQVWFFDDDD